MTDMNLPRSTVSREFEWNEILADYREACATLRYAVSHAAATGEDVDALAADDHANAARALIETPARHIAHVGQKLRAVHNLTDINQLYPNLEAILLTDLLGLIGIDDESQPVLPASVQQPERRQRAA